MHSPTETIRLALELALQTRRAIRRMMAEGARCPGLEIEPGAWSGCDQGALGTNDCPIHGEDGDAEIRHALAQLDGLRRALAEANTSPPPANTSTSSVLPEGSKDDEPT